MIIGRNPSWRRLHRWRPFARPGGTLLLAHATFAVLTTLAADAAADFADTKAKAAELDSIDKAVAAMVGDCEGADFENAIACQENRKAEQKQLRSKQQYINIGYIDEGTLEYVGPQKSGKVRLLWVPIVDAGGYGLTLKKPIGLDANGRPRLKKMVLDAELPAGMLASDVQRAVRLSMVTVDVIGKFGKPWRLKKKQHTASGVVFKAKYVRFSHARTGKTVGTIKLR